jgi:hypothetical protein
MSIYNIQTNTEYDIPKATWPTGNKRENVSVRPTFGITNYTSCVYDISLTGNIISLRSCRLDTEAWHGAQPNPDTMINNIIMEKYS